MDIFKHILNIPLSPIICGFLIYLSVKIKQSKSDNKHLRDAIVKREMEAMFSPKKELPKDIFLYLDTNLPFDKIIINNKIESSINRLKNELTNLQCSKLLKLNPKLQNVELKEKYGFSTLESIITYEQNYNKTIINLNEIARILIQDSQYSVAESFLLECVRLDSETSKTYIYLIDIYLKTDNKKLNSFISKFKQDYDNNNSFFVKKVLEYYKNIYEK